MTFWHIVVFSTIHVFSKSDCFFHNLFQTYGRDLFSLNNIRFGKDH